MLRTAAVAGLLSCLAGCSHMTLRARGSVVVPRTSVSLSSTQPQEIANGARLRVAAKPAAGVGLVELVIENMDETKDLELVWERSSFASAQGFTRRVVDANARAFNTRLVQANLIIQSKAAAQVVAAIIDAPTEDFAAPGSLKLAFAREGETSSVSLPLRPLVFDTKTKDELVEVDRAYRVGFGGHLPLCVLTGIFYGGWCWAYLFLPFEPQRQEAVSKLAADVATQYGPSATLTDVVVERVSW